MKNYFREVNDDLDFLYELVPSEKHSQLGKVVDKIKSKWDEGTEQVKSNALYDYKAKDTAIKAFKNSKADDKTKLNFYIKAFSKDILSQYKIVDFEKGLIMDNDGVSRAKNLDGTGFYDTIDEAVNDTLKVNRCHIENSDILNNVTEVKVKKGVAIVQGKEVDMLGSNWLEKELS